jgi:hypothetical protein
MRRLYRRGALHCHDASVRPETSAGTGPGAPDEPIAAAHSRLAAYAGRKVAVGLRPGCLPSAADGHTGPALVGDVDLVEALGAKLMVHFTIDARRIRAEGATEAGTEAATGWDEDVVRVEP